MSLLVVGSVAFDSIETPFGKVEEVLGGSALYFATAASHFTDVRLVAVVGEDFPEEPVGFLRGRGVDVAGLHRSAGKTFRWKGKYGYDLNEAVTLDTQLNVFGEFKPELSDDYRDSEFVFLANIDPELQYEVLEQVRAPKFVAADTMNFWIEGKPEALRRTLERVDMLLLNEGEARALSEQSNMVKAGQAIRAMGPEWVVIKRGEYGALLFGPDEIFFAPAYPLEDVFDPTGAGDSFAGGFIGYLARSGDLGEASLRRAVIYGSAMGSFAVERFSIGRLMEIGPADIARRVDEFHRLVAFEAELRA